MAELNMFDDSSNFNNNRASSNNPFAVNNSQQLDSAQAANALFADIRPSTNNQSATFSDRALEVAMLAAVYQKLTTTTNFRFTMADLNQFYFYFLAQNSSLKQKFNQRGGFTRENQEILRSNFENYLGHILSSLSTSLREQVFNCPERWLSDDFAEKINTPIYEGSIKPLIDQLRISTGIPKKVLNKRFTEFFADYAENKFASAAHLTIEQLFTQYVEKCGDVQFSFYKDFSEANIMRAGKMLAGFFSRQFPQTPEPQWLQLFLQYYTSNKPEVLYILTHPKWNATKQFEELVLKFQCKVLPTREQGEITGNDRKEANFRPKIDVSHRKLVSARRSKGNEENKQGGNFANNGYFPSNSNNDGFSNSDQQFNSNSNNNSSNFSNNFGNNGNNSFGQSSNTNFGFNSGNDNSNPNNNSNNSNNSNNGNNSSNNQNDGFPFNFNGNTSNNGSNSANNNFNPFGNSAASHNSGFHTNSSSSSFSFQ
jgi:hypothetical protein